MTEQRPSGERARRARQLVEELQELFVQILEAVSTAHQDDTKFAPIHWLRDEGLHGGGTRMVVMDTFVFDRASINVSGVHYDDVPTKKLGSATALSCIVHPAHPQAPSMHMHISWTEMKSGTGGFRLMADLNPSHVHEADQQRFDAILKRAAGDQYEEGKAQGDRYFTIPALDRTRGVSHCYLEGYGSDDFSADLAFAKGFAEAVIDGYCMLLANRLTASQEPTEQERDAQVAYHSLYLFQVLTMDRGTTSGLLVHDQNDVGILGSLPSTVDCSVLTSFRSKMPPIQQQLLDQIVATLGSGVVTVDEDMKRALAKVVRCHYQQHPEALAHQASASLLTSTVENHR